MVDLELTRMNTVHAVFPISMIKGCQFYYSHFVWHNVINQGLKQQYDENEHIRKDIQKLLPCLLFPYMIWKRHLIFFLIQFMIISKMSEPTWKRHTSEAVQPEEDDELFHLILFLRYGIWWHIEWNAMN